MRKYSILNALGLKGESSISNSSLEQTYRDKFLKNSPLPLPEVNMDFSGSTTVKSEPILGSGFTGNMNNEYTGVGSVVSALAENIKTKTTLIEKLDEIRSFDYIESPIRDLGTDTMTKNFDPSERSYFQFVMKQSGNENEEKKKVNKELIDKVNDYLVNSKLYEMILENVEDFLLYGEYLFKNESDEDGGGIIDDSVEQNTTVPIYEKGTLVKVYEIGNKKLVNPSKYVVLTLFKSPKKIRIKSASGKYYYVRIPRGVINESLIEKIKALKILETLQPMTELMAIDEKLYFYVRFPQGKDMNEAYQEVNGYERFLKSVLSLDTPESVSEILDKITKVKVIPLFGSQEEIRPQTISKVNRIELAQLNDLRDSISSSMKIDIMSKEGENSPQYLKLIKRIRKMIASSVKVHISHKLEEWGDDLDYSEFEILTPELKGADDIDVIDYTNLYSSTLKEVSDLISDLNGRLLELVNPENGSTVDVQKVVDYYNEKMRPIIGHDIFSVKALLGDSNTDNTDNDEN